MSKRPIDKLQIIQRAACHTCGSRPGQPCVFARKDDPRGLRAHARQSHLDRIQRARKFDQMTQKALADLDFSV